MCGKHLTIAVHLACQICDMHYSIDPAGVGGGTACGVSRMIGIPESQLPDHEPVCRSSVRKSQEGGNNRSDSGLLVLRRSLVRGL